MLLGVNFARMLASANTIIPQAEGKHRSEPACLATSWGKALPEPVARAVDYILTHLDQELSLADLTGAAQYSQRRLTGLFKEALRMSPMAFVRARRIHEAKRLLAEGLPVKEIAARLKFADSQHFSRVFRQATGLSPTEFAGGQLPLQQPPSGAFATDHRRIGNANERSGAEHDQMAGRAEKKAAL